MMYVQEPCTALWSGPTNCGKTQLVLDLIENEYRNHFDNIIIICSTIRWNKTYLTRRWLWSDDNVFLRMHKGFSTILRIFFYKNKNTQKTYIKPYIIRKLNKFSFH